EKERDKETSKSNPSVIWLSTLSCLGQLDSAEKLYTGLLFLLPKGFLRKDSSLKSMYEALCADLSRIEENGRTASSDSLEKVLAHLCGQLSFFARARLQLTEFYEHTCSMGANRQINFDELLAHIREITDGHLKKFHHPSLSPLKSSFRLFENSFECEILVKLLEVQIAMQSMVFLSAILHLHEAHSKLCAWESTVQLRDTRRSFSFVSKQSNPAHYHWLWKFKDALVSKVQHLHLLSHVFTLFFSTVHALLPPNPEQTDDAARAKKRGVASIRRLSFQVSSAFVPQSDCRLKQSFLPIRLRLVSFQRKTDAKYVLLIFDSADCDQYKGRGYQHPDRFFEPPRGVESFQAVVSYPTKPSHLWPSIVMTMSDKANELNTMERIVSLYDNVLQFTYFLTRIEPRITLVVIYDSKKSERDSYINTFMTTFPSQLRSNKLLTSLKPGSK
uniref:Uncharacterized protein n=1 Tax=Strigamia maritima TaxID=126957 RepID=T1JCZ0_STRMM